MPGFPIVDSHVHFLEPGRFEYPWLRSDSPIRRRFGVDDFMHAHAGVAVEAIVFVEAWTAPGQNVDEARFVQGLADHGAPVAGIVANATVVDDRKLRFELDQLAQMRTVRGIRYLIEGAVDPSFCLEGDFPDSLRAAAKLDLPFDLCLKHWALPFGVELARRLPEVNFVLDHIGKPGIRHGMKEPWWTAIQDMAALPNVVCKLSAVITEDDHSGWSYERIRPYVERAIECFGLDRMMFGSDWPVSELTHSYADWVDFLDRVLGGCSEQNLRRFYRDNAIETYRLKLEA